jgi:hypothetical protein
MVCCTKPRFRDERDEIGGLQRRSHPLDMAIRRCGPPKTNAEIRDLIRRMSSANPFWGALRIYGEWLKLGVEAGQVGRYLPRRPQPLSDLKPGLRSRLRQADRHRLHLHADGEFGRCVQPVSSPAFGRPGGTAGHLRRCISNGPRLDRRRSPQKSSRRAGRLRSERTASTWRPTHPRARQRSARPRVQAPWDSTSKQHETLLPRNKNKILVTASITV